MGKFVYMGSLFYFLEYTLHHFIGSDVSSFKANIDNSKDSDNKINGNQYCVLRIGFAILLFYIGGENMVVYYLNKIIQRFNIKQNLVYRKLMKMWK